VSFSFGFRVLSSSSSPLYPQRVKWDFIHLDLAGSESDHAYKDEPLKWVTHNSLAPTTTCWFKIVKVKWENRLDYPSRSGITCRCVTCPLPSRTWAKTFQNSKTPNSGRRGEALMHYCSPFISDRKEGSRVWANGESTGNKEYLVISVHLLLRSLLKVC